MAKFNHTGHKELWDWLAQNPDKSKGNWPGWIWNGGEYNRQRALCFACEYTGEDCKVYNHCPLVWPCNCESKKGLYRLWRICKDYNLRTKFAERIRDLPVREGVECE